MSHTLFFILGFCTVYYTLGYGSNVFAEFFSQYEDLIRKLSAILIVLMGLFLAGIFQPQVLMKERRFNFDPTKKPAISAPLFLVSASPLAGRLVSDRR